MGNNSTSTGSSALFGYIFGGSSYTGGMKTIQYYSSSSYTVYCIPSSLKEVIITGGNINYGAFYNCSNLTSITIPSSVRSIGENAFYNCGNITDMYYGGTIEDWLSISFSTLDSNPMYWANNFYIINENGDVKHSNFKYSLLTSIEIPSSITSINFYAFKNCSSLTNVTFEEGSQLTTIRKSAFENCSSLTSIEIPSSVTSIDFYAFENCSSLTNVTFEEGSQLTTIGRYAFSGCENLTSIIIPKSLTSISECAFYKCSSLTKVYYAGTEKEYDAITVNSTGNTQLSEATIYYFSDSEPQGNGNYWHYDENGSVKIWE